MAQPWSFDELSEDWEEEVRSSPPASLPRGTPASSVRRRADQSPDSISNHRPQNDAGSPTSVKKQEKMSSIISQIVAEQSKNIHNSTISSLHRSTISSNGSVVHFDTVARKSRSSSPPKSRNGHEPSTPDWKKLIMKGQPGLVVQQDLFSPIGLEGIFRRPEEDDETNSVPKKVPRRLFLKNDENVPSSPPPWPKPNKTASVRFADFPTIREAPSFSSEAEGNSVDQSQQEQESTNDESVPLSTTSDQQNVLSHHLDQIVTSDNGQNDAELNAGNNSQEDAEDMESTSRTFQGTVKSAISQASTSAASAFSPVMISKYNTADGKIDYAPVDASRPNISQFVQESPSINGTFQPEEGNTSTESRSYDHDDAAETKGARPFRSSILEGPDFSPSASSSIAPADSISQIYIFGGADTAPQPLLTSTAAQTAPDKVTAKQAQTPTSPQTPSPRLQIAKKVLNSASPLKLFTNNDTYTNGRLMNRMANLSIEEGSQTEAQNPSRRSAKKNQFSFRSPSAAGPALGLEASFQANEEPEENVSSSSQGVYETIRNRPVTPDMLGQGILTQTKRRPSPPSKHPTPKRQRTLFPSEIKQAAQYMADVVEDQHRRLKATEHALNRNALKDEDSTQSQLQVPGRNEAHTVDGTQNFDDLSELEQFSLLQSQIEEAELKRSNQDAGTVKALATQVAKFQLKTITGLKDSARKPSVSTQDYLDEALKIMDIIRSSRPLPQNELSYLKEADSELSHDSEQVRDEYTPQHVSRPQSRQGAPSAWRSMNDTELDPRLVSRLEKYAETGEETLMMSSMRKSLRASHPPPESMNEDDDSINAIETDLPNIRISGPRSSSGYRVSSFEIRPTSHHSNGSADDTNRSADTNSTGRTKTVPTISPGKVSHLITSIEQAAGMRYDRERQVWFKNKASRSQPRPNDLSSSTGTEDPFEQIPDLSTHGSEVPSRQTSSISQQTTRSGYQNQDGPSESDSSRPSLSEFPLPGKKIPPSAPGREPTIEVHPDRKTSQPICTQPLQNLDVLYEESQLAEDELPQAFEDDEFEETNYVDDTENIPPTPDRVSKVPDGTIRSKRRGDSADFSSSPVVELWRSNQHNEDDSSEERAEVVELPKKDQGKRLAQPRSAPLSDLRRQALRNVSHAQNNRLMSLTHRDERREISFVEQHPDGRTLSMTWAVSTPLPLQRQQTAGHVVLQGGDSSGLLQTLSPLSEFTMNQNTAHHLQKNNLVPNMQAVISVPSTQGPAVVVGKLVEKLTDVEPDEPYWDSMRLLDLRNKSLSDVHMLDQFCPGVEQLDLSNNHLQQVGGVPICVRQLSVRSNHLCSITNWGHLPHLQYLDISGNKLDNLEALGDLLHLRELKADDNNITTIEGIFDHDSLLSLSVKRNKLTQVDFSSADMKRLSKLDLSGNAIESVQGLHCLPGLTHLDLGQNKLRSFVVDEAMTLRSLTELCVSHNEVESLELIFVPRLSRLDADNNKIQRLPRVNQEHVIQSLSLRNQTLSGTFELNLDDLTQFSDISHLYLSGTSLSSLPTDVAFLNLRTLEMALTGLQALPGNFGKLMPNLRDLNLNMNSLRDLRPLRGLAKLNRLYVAGNRLSRLRKTIDVVQGLAKGGNLTTVDFRDNPVIVSIYGSLPSVQSNELPITTLSSITTTTSTKSTCESEDMQYLLPLGNVKLDHMYEARLDEDTKLRRRVFELLLAAKCPKLQMVDGLPWAERKQKVLRKDETWARLVEMGVIADKC